MEDEKKAEVIEKKDSELKKKFSKLIDVKSLMTLTMTVAFVALTLAGKNNVDQFTDIFKTIVIFYFGTQAAKA